MKQCDYTACTRPLVLVAAMYSDLYHYENLVQVLLDDGKVVLDECHLTKYNDI